MGSFPDTLAPFVPTPYDVVDRMLLLGEVTAADTVYDLGCGDGRIIVAAAQKYGARGVGVDIQPGMMEMTLENIAQAGVGNLVEFRMQDAQTIDLRPATVITLYLVQWSMARFEPIILRTDAEKAVNDTLRGMVNQLFERHRSFRALYDVEQPTRSYQPQVSGAA